MLNSCEKGALNTHSNTEDVSDVYGQNLNLLTPNSQTWLKLIKEYAKVALSRLHSSIYTSMK
jgi:hypothetical protein